MHEACRGRQEPGHTQKKKGRQGRRSRKTARERQTASKTTGQEQKRKERKQREKRIRKEKKDSKQVMGAGLQLLQSMQEPSPQPCRRQRWVAPEILTCQTPSALRGPNQN